MVTVRTDLKFTYQEYRALPETGPRYQLLDGELSMSPAPSYRHQMILARLFFALYAFVDRAKSGVVLFSPLDVVFDEENVAQPDIVYLSNARRSIIAPEGLHGGPDLCIEALSEKTRNIDLKVKRLLYARHGVTEYWIADPEADTVEVHRLQEKAAAPVQTFGISDTLTSPLFPGLSINLKEIFRRP